MKSSNKITKTHKTLRETARDTMTLTEYNNAIEAINKAGGRQSQVDALHRRIGVTERVIMTHPNGLRMLGLYLPTGELISKFTAGPAQEANMFQRPNQGNPDLSYACLRGIVVKQCRFGTWGHLTSYFSAKMLKADDGNYSEAGPRNRRWKKITAEQANTILDGELERANWVYRAEPL